MRVSKVRRGGGETSPSRTKGDEARGLGSSPLGHWIGSSV